ncbi:MAG: hypothetical protein JO027_18010 [Solirubrobacterales bacterium]|nr:hypothetical protein [Solirubrobacterales bacterium]
MKRLFGSHRRRMGGAGLVVAMLVLAASVGTALAATLTGGNTNNTIIGTPNAPDTITDGNGNDIIFGLGGSTTQGDTITAGNGNNVIDADGKCSQGYDTVTPGYGAAAYCELSQGNPKEGRSTITVGSGDNVIVGGAGPNTITAGVGSKGSDLIVGGQVGDTITSGNGGNLIFLGSGSLYKGSTVTDGSGSSVIVAQNGVKDTITCAPGNNTTVFADKIDVIHGCAHVTYSHNNAPSYSLATVRMPSARGATHKAKKAAHKHKGRRHTSR